METFMDMIMGKSVSTGNEQAQQVHLLDFAYIACTTPTPALVDG
jgi:hypothetical protein